MAENEPRHIDFCRNKDIIYIIITNMLTVSTIIVSTRRHLVKIFIALAAYKTVQTNRSCLFRISDY